MNLETLNKLLILSWDKDTCSPGLRDFWNTDNPSIGQCAITALVVNDVFGGEIMRCMSSTGSHYYNLIEGNIVDLTVEQFLGENPLYDSGEERSREYLLSYPDTKKRYETLLYNLKQSIRQVEGKRFKLIGSDGEVYLSSVPGRFGGNRRLKIYGRLDCSSANRWVSKGYYVSDRVFFLNEEDAIGAGYRPCAVCMPEEYKAWKGNSLKLSK